MSDQQFAPRIRGHALIALAAGLLLYLSIEQYWEALASAETALDRLETSRRQAVEIEQMRDRPPFAGTVIEDLSTLTRRIADARQSADLAEQAVDLVDPRSPVRISDSSYLLRPVAIQLRGLLLPQTVRFVATLGDVESGMWVNHLRLTPVQRDDEDEEPELWNVDLNLTQVIFSPKSS